MPFNHFYDELCNWLNSHKPEQTWHYPVPKLGEGGTCSLFGELDEKPFDLSQVLTQREQALVTKFQSIVDWVKVKTGVDWFGIYLKRETADGQRVLTKCSYFGAPSRAEFPVTEEFAQISNNSKVALTGEERVIHDVDAFRSQGGEYYTCDPKVKSELCWPILTADADDKNTYAPYTQGKILGIIDAECFKTHCFDEQTQAIFRAVCQLLSKLLTTPPQLNDPNKVK